jgi:DMSO/TMAO reductase YedYZ molybdopterin-dependent catalytic subunit
MLRAFTIILLLISTLQAFSQPGAQEVIVIEGEVTTTLRLSVKDLEKFPVSETKTKDRDGKEHVYKGVALSVVLDSAGVTLGKSLRGENLVKYMLVTAADNYQVIYSLPEIDPEFTSNIALLATQVDGKPLPQGEGPFRLVNPADKRPARWVREIRSIKIVFSK